MNDLIVKFLENKVDGDTIENVRLTVTKGFGLDHVKTEERLDEMVEDGDLQRFFISAEPRYAIDQP